MNPIRISAKTLGLLALPTCCPRCYWLRLRLRSRMPYGVFPGIFASIDAFTKAVTHRHFDRFGRLPSWVSPCCDKGVPVPVPSLSRFQFLDEENNVLLTGVPDEIIACDEHGVAILDYKTARYTDAADALLPMYRVQLGVYAVIAEKLGLAPVTRLALLYCEPPALPLSAIETAHVFVEGGYAMPFRAKVVKVGFDAATELPPLLRRARDICSAAAPPQPSPQCRDCVSVAHIMSLIWGASGSSRPAPREPVSSEAPIDLAGLSLAE